MDNAQQKLLKEKDSNNKDTFSLFDYDLFLGFDKIPAFEQEMSKNNPYLISLLTSGDLYLTKVEHNNKTYLGKFLKKMPTLQEIESSETHILSLLRLLVPNHLILANSLSLFAAPHA